MYFQIKELNSIRSDPSSSFVKPHKMRAERSPNSTLQREEVVITYLAFYVAGGTE
jgi:hypothetical protein